MARLAEVVKVSMPEGGFDRKLPPAPPSTPESRRAFAERRKRDRAAYERMAGRTH